MAYNAGFGNLRSSFDYWCPDQQKGESMKICSECYKETKHLYSLFDNLLTAHFNLKNKLVCSDCYDKKWVDWMKNSGIKFYKSETSCDERN